MNQPLAALPRGDEKRRIAACFAAAAASYDHAAALQREIGLSLIERLATHRAIPSSGPVLDLGCGTGFMLEQLIARGVAAPRLIGADLALPMLIQGRGRRSTANWLCADAERLPFTARSLELIVSNLAVQWLDRPDRFLAEAARTLRPGGWLAFTTLGTETLAEFGRLCDDTDRSAPLNRFISSATLKASLARTPFKLISHHRSRHLRRYPSVRALMHALKRLGAHHLVHPLEPPARRCGLGGRARLIELERLASQRYPEGVPASYDTHFIILEKPD